MVGLCVFQVVFLYYPKLDRVYFYLYLFRMLSLETERVYFFRYAHQVTIQERSLNIWKTLPFLIIGPNMELPPAMMLQFHLRVWNCSWHSSMLNLIPSATLGIRSVKLVHTERWNGWRFNVLQKFLAALLVVMTLVCVPRCLKKKRF